MVSLSSWRANNAFVFSVKDGRDRLRFGIQLLPRRVVVYTAEKAPVYFTYNWQDGHQHPFAVGVCTHSVSFYANCGAVQQRKQIMGRSQTLWDSGGLFTLGRMNSKAAPFNGRMCQLDIYPSAQAAAHYCKYLKTQCRLADTYRLAHNGMNMVANDPPLDPSTISHVEVVATHHSPIKNTAALKPSPNHLVTQFTTLSPSLQPHLEDQSTLSTVDALAHSTTSMHQPESPTLSTLSEQGVLDLTHSTSVTTSKIVWTKDSNSEGDADLSENSSEDENSPDSLQTPDATPGPISPVRQSQVKEGNSTSTVDFVPQQTQQLVETHPRANGTTLYREDQVGTSEQHELNGSYDDVDTGGYDYGYEETDFLYEYEDGFRGPKGELGPMVSNRVNYLNSYDVCGTVFEEFRSKLDNCCK